MDQRIINLYDRFTHGGMSRREFLDRLAELAGSAAAAAALVPLLQNDYAQAAIVAADDARLATERLAYDSPKGKINGYLARATAKGVVARLKGIGDRTAAEALKGVELYVDRDRLPAAAEGEFYHADLIGLAAVDPEGRQIGEIVAVQNFGAGDLLEIRLAGSGKTELVPFTEATVPEVDIAAGRAMVAMPAASNDEEE